MTWLPGLSGTSIYCTDTFTTGSNPLKTKAISFCVLSFTSCPRIRKEVDAMPKISYPPSPLRNAQAVYIPSFNSPVVFLNSKWQFSSFAISRFMSSIVIAIFLMCFRPQR